MPQFVVVSTDDVPPEGSTKQVSMYRGDHANEDAAVEYAAAVFGKSTGDWLWGVGIGNFTRYVCTESRSWTAEPG